MRSTSAVQVGAALMMMLSLSITVSATTNNNNDDGIISFPLLTHHHVVERRRRELLHGDTNLSSLSLDNDDEDRIPINNNLRHLSEHHAQQQLGALYQGYGTHYIDIWVGYPAQRQTAIVDTGSSVTAFPCSSCTDCGQHTDPPFNEDASQSFRATHCPIVSAENEGCVFGKCSNNGLCLVEHSFGVPGSPGASSWTAYEAQDVAYAGGPHDRPIDGSKPLIDPSTDEANPIHAPEFSFPLTFACQTSVSGYFEKQLASGVMGLDRRSQSFWGQMHSSQTISNAKFSLCFVKQPIASMSGSTAGAVTLGGVDNRLHKTPMVFANSITEGSTASFKVQMRKMYLREGNDMSVMYDAKQKYHLLDVTPQELNGNEMYNFDSGTTDTYFIKSLSDEFRKLWVEITGMEYTNEPIMVSKNSDLLKLPTVVLQMIPHMGGVGDEVQTSDPRTVPGLAGNVDVSMPNDVLLAIPPQHYMQRNAKDNTYTSRIYLDRDDALGNVLGANTMMGHDILFDLDEERIGFAESECDYARLVTESGRASNSNEGGSESSSSGKVLPAEEENTYHICESMKCRGFFGLTVAVLFIGFFYFARRYINKSDDSSYGTTTTSSLRGGQLPSEYEMKSARNLHSSNRSFDGSYRDEQGGYRDSVGGYSDRGSSRHLDRASSSSARRDRSGSRESERGSRSGERRSSRDRGERRSSSREPYDGGASANRSINSHRSHSSGGSGGSGGSRETARSHRSSRSHDTHRSNRSSHSRESNRSGKSHRSSGSRESQRTSESRRSHHSSSSRRFRDEFDEEAPMPPFT